MNKSKKEIIEMEVIMREIADSRCKRNCERDNKILADVTR
jgi:hypothetical protein